MPVGAGAARATARVPRRPAEGDPFRRSADVIGPICQRLERLAKDGAAMRHNPPDSKCAADVRAHAFAERQHMPPVRQGLKRGSVARPSPVRIALDRDLMARPAPVRRVCSPLVGSRAGARISRTFGFRRRAAGHSSGTRRASSRVSAGCWRPSASPERSGQRGLAAVAFAFGEVG